MRSFKRNQIYIGLGSNLGDCKENLATAVSLLKKYFRRQPKTSAIYRSAPVEVIEQPWFLNQVAALSLREAWLPTDILKVLKQIEVEIGREPNYRYGPRLIDLDLLFYNQWVLETETLILPHPKLVERSFVLQPLLELAPTLIHPRLGRSIQAIWDERAEELSFCEKENNNDQT